MNNENNKKLRHKKRGMTLVEVIISIAVMAILALLLTTIGVTVDTYRKDTKARNDKIAVEGPAAESRDKEKNNGRGKLIDEEFKITVKKSGGMPVEVTGKLYSTSDELTDTGTTDSDGEKIYSGNTKGHFKFIDIGN
ncbi:MAG: type II secretion system GspH family protein [Ruminococcus sp.]|nr:type II secretion system GspH family protein [Ruminococcus sp.]